MKKKRSEGMRRRWPAFLLLIIGLALVGGGGVKAQEAEKRGKEPVPAHLLVDPSAPALGPENAKVVIVEFADFQCPACAQGCALMEEVRKKFPEEIRLVWMDRPLNEIMDDGFPFHPLAMVAHEAAAAAQAQNKFWEMKEWIFAHQRELFPRKRPQSEEELKKQKKELEKKLLKAAEELKLDPLKLKLALARRQYQEVVQKRLKMALALEIFTTPTIFVNGVKVESYEQFKALVEEGLGRPWPED